MPLYEHTSGERVWQPVEKKRDGHVKSAIPGEIKRLDEASGWRKISDTYPPADSEPPAPPDTSQPAETPKTEPKTDTKPVAGKV